jgi:hypothetical protein
MVFWLKRILLLGFLFCSLSGKAQDRLPISGRVLDPAGNPLPYASISADDFRYGTLSGEDGTFLLKLPAGSHILLITYLGFESYRDTLRLQAGLQKDFVLQPEDLDLPTVVITEDGRDPAYTIIRKAINRKKRNARPFPEYTYHAYTKTWVGFPKDFKPDSLMLLAASMSVGGGQADTELPPELESRILYLSETLSDLAVREPEKVKETILSSRVSGDAGQFSIFGNLVNRFDPYENRLIMEGIADRGIASPIADNAFFYYDYKLLGTVQEDGYQAFKIRVIPKREFDPCFRGTIYIADSSFAVKELDVFISRRQQLEILDTLVLQQAYMPLNGAWIPIKTRMAFSFVFDLLAVKIPFEGASSSLLSNYQVAPGLAKRFFSSEILTVSDSALKMPPGSWDQIRPIPLTEDEIADYRLKDSLEVVYNSPEYLDSLTRADRSPSLNNLVFFGENFRNYRKKTEVSVSPLIETAGFNPIEGWFVSPVVSFKKEIAPYTKIILKPELRYGFSARRFGYRLTVGLDGRLSREGKLSVSGGDMVREYSEFPQIDPFWNTTNALFRKRSLMRLYRSRSVSVSYEREVLNGMRASINLSYDNRLNLANTTDYSWSRNTEAYDPNIEIAAHQALISDIRIRYRPFNKFFRTPDGKLNLGSDWPEFEIRYTQAFGGLPGNSSHFSRVVAGITDKTFLGILGTLSWRVSAGKYLHKEAVYFPDFFHFKGNETNVHTGGRFDAFYMMPYYAYSSTMPYVELHAEHAFNGFIFNKIPGIRKLQLNEYAGVHLLWQEATDPYVEMNFGLEKKFLKIIPLRLDLTVSILGNPWRPIGVIWNAPDLSGLSN